MAKVKVAIEETVVQEFEFDVADGELDRAVDIAIQKYRDGELVLEPGEVQSRQISVVGPEPTEWVEF